MTEHHLNDLPETIPGAFAEICRTAPDRIAMQMKVGSHYEQYTFSKMAQQVQGLAMGFMQEGIRPGSRVVLLSENRPEWVITYLGIVTAGGTVVPLDIQMSRQEVLALVEQSRSQLVVASNQTLDLVKNLPPPIRVLSLDTKKGTGRTTL